MSRTETIGKITSRYQGILSENLNWNQARLDDIARIADLRTTVLIREGEEKENTNYENLGETLAWKKLAHPVDLLRGSADKTNRVEVSLSSNKEYVQVLINHQLVQADITQSNQGKFDERAFTKTINRLALQGLNHFIAQEKFWMTINSGVVGGICFGSMAISAGLGYLCAKGTITESFVAPPTRPFSFDQGVIDSYYAYFLPRIFEASVVMESVLFNCSMLNLIAKENTAAKNSDDPYRTGFQDIYNPLKHLKDYLSGYLALKTSAPVVEYKP